MKRVYVIASLALWTVVNANYEWHLKCPVTQCKCPEKYATNLPHETDCTKFYKCDWCRPVLQNCSLSGIPGYERLHYNRRLQVCDWPWQAGCESCTKPEVDKCSYENEKISNPKDDCNTYFECKNGKPRLCRCDPGTCFSRTCQACVEDRAGGNCGPPTTPGPWPCKKGERKCHDCNCRSYYECKQIEGDATGWFLQYCEGGLYYNPDIQECDDANNARPICEAKCLHKDDS
ncbi:hypothetical protein EAG_06072 [Camponotus floridanus]|uniref:Chitin-binding type-2 domain-containing protein n=1 Tax=Camponotus floridanus TaxID=104421 RepID=E2A5C4_CAMFO|nr:peritrophin-1 [Camponotus floridanus]EFN71346.1 hypothetical protein EAG_06072 [Camponotus floridanus]